MRKLKIVSLALCVLLPFSCLLAVDLGSPVGYWKTKDDHTGHDTSVVRLYKNKQGLLVGKVWHIYLVDGQQLSDRCVKCEGELKDHPMLGLPIFPKGLFYQDKEWVGGEILDPKSGSVYRCELSLEEGGRELKVRGYIGIPLLGRTQTWSRIEALPVQNWSEKR